MKNLKASLVKLTPDERLYNYEKPLIGLTGGIATGKSAVTKYLREQGLKVIDADQLVKSIYETEECRKFIQKNFPLAFENGAINFPKLRELFFQDLKSKAAIETFIYERLPEAFKKATQELKDQNFCIYDVPLLFEKKLDQKTDLSIVIYTPRDIQLVRLMKRDQINRESAERILDAQMDIEEKKNLADFVIHNDGTLEELAADVGQLLLQVLE